MYKNDTRQKRVFRLKRTWSQLQSISRTNQHLIATEIGIGSVKNAGELRKTVTTAWHAIHNSGLHPETISIPIRTLQPEGHKRRVDQTRSNLWHCRCDPCQGKHLHLMGPMGQQGLRAFGHCSASCIHIIDDAKRFSSYRSFISDGKGPPEIFSPGRTAEACLGRGIPHTLEDIGTNVAKSLGIKETGQEDRLIQSAPFQPFRREGNRNDQIGGGNHQVVRIFDDMLESRQDRGIAAVLEAMEESTDRLIIIDYRTGLKKRRRMAETGATEISAILIPRNLLAAADTERRLQIIYILLAAGAQASNIANLQEFRTEKASRWKNQIEADRSPALFTFHFRSTSICTLCISRQTWHNGQDFIMCLLA